MREADQVPYISTGGKTKTHQHTAANDSRISWGTIKQGKILLRVPWELILCKEQVEKDPALQSILHQWASTEPEKYTSQAICLWLLHGAGHTDWSPWLSKLPHDIGAGAESLPLALAFCHSDALRGTSLQHAAELQLESLRSEWGRLKQFLDVSLERFIWAQAMLSTRSSTLPMDGKVLSCLIPVVDFVNHDFHPNAFIQGRKQGVELISCEGIPPGLAVVNQNFISKSHKLIFYIKHFLQNSTCQSDVLD